MANYLDYLIEEDKFQNMEEDDIFNGMVQDYMGTCDSFADEDYEWLEVHLLEENWGHEIYRCPQCGWWVEPCERREPNDGWEDICEDCHEGS